MTTASDTPAAVSGSTRRPLKILEVASHFPGWGGTEIHLINVSAELIRRGHSVTVSCRPGRFVEKEALKRSLPVFHASVQKQMDWSDALRYYRYLRQERFDVVHAHWRQDYVVPLAMARLARVPVRLISHHSPYPLKKKEVALLPGRLAVRLIALSESVRRTLTNCGVPEQRVVTIHHGTDIDAFQQTTLPVETTRAEWGIPPERFVIGFVGRLSEEKGYTTFFDAVAAVLRQGGNVHAVVVGDGPDGEIAKARAAQPDLAGRVTFAGFRSDVNNAMNALDTFVLASTWAEPCAAVVQQAMALSKPVIGTDTGGTPEMVAGGETGLLVPPGDVPALVAAIQTLVKTPSSQRQTMGHAGRERVEKLFSQKVMVDKIEARYYEELALSGR